MPEAAPVTTAIRHRKSGFDMRGTVPPRPANG
jgi:hypothetical protein